MRVSHSAWLGLGVALLSINACGSSDESSLRGGSVDNNANVSSSTGGATEDSDGSTAGVVNGGSGGGSALPGGGTPSTGGAAVNGGADAGMTNGSAGIGGGSGGSGTDGDAGEMNPRPCAAGQKRCGGICVTIEPSRGCSSIDEDCAACIAPPNATAICNADQCDFMCTDGFIRAGGECSAAPCDPLACPPCPNAVSCCTAVGACGCRFAWMPGCG